MKLHSTHVLPALAALCLAIANPCALAQTAGANQKGVVPPPPVQKGLSEDLEPTVTIKQVDGQQVEEFRIRGKLYMMRVTPKGGKPYVLVDKAGTGHFEVGENYSPHLSVPQWVIMEF